MITSQQGNQTDAADSLEQPVAAAAAYTGLHDSDAQPALRGEVADMLSKSVTSLHDMLNDLLSLPRLEAGQEQRELTTFAAAALVRAFCILSQTAAPDGGRSRQ